MQLIKTQFNYVIFKEKLLNVSLELCDINRLPRRYAPRSDGEGPKIGMTLFLKDNKILNFQCIG